MSYLLGYSDNNNETAYIPVPIITMKLGYYDNNNETAYIPVDIINIRKFFFK